ncbi:hypothetical protein C4A75_03960 [Brevibacillus laterosporus]|nr:hypothetical protein C4A75_03960 [Brevibacillus laterosporus]
MTRAVTFQKKRTALCIIVFEFFGAGQKVSQVTFGGNDWRISLASAKYHPFNQTSYGLYLRLKGRLEFLMDNVKSAVAAILTSREAFRTIRSGIKFIKFKK